MPRSATEPWMPASRPPTKAEVWKWVTHHDDGATPDLIGVAQRIWAWAFTHWANHSAWNKPPDWKPGEPICAWALPGRIDEDDYEQAVCKLWLDQKQYVAERTAA